MKRLILIDSHAIIHRAYHALPPLTTPVGEPINAVYGFTTILLRILRELKPDYIAAAFDLPGPTFRHVAYERYKAQRPETPSELSSQFSKVRELLEAFHIPVIQKESYEADDIIGTLVEKIHKKKDVEIIIVTGDMDALQLVRPRVKVYAMKKGITETVVYDEKAVYERYGFKPAQLIDFKGLKGDPSDNIAGVKGIGEKTAQDLIAQFGSIHGIYAALKKNKIDSVSLVRKLTEGEQDALMSRELATIKRDVPIDIDFNTMQWHEDQSKETVRALFGKFGFTSLLKRFAPSPSEPVLRPAHQATLLETTAAKLSGAAKSWNDFATAISQKDHGRFGFIVDTDELCIVSETTGDLFVVTSRDGKTAEAKKILGSLQDIYAYDGKALIHFLKGFGILCKNISFDMMLAAYLTGTYTRDVSFFAVANRELGRLVVPGVREEFRHFFEIVRLLDAKLSVGKIREVFSTIELPLIPILADMEDQGILINREFLKALAGNIDRRLQELTKKIYRVAGEEFNINSSQQLSRILFEKLGLNTAGLRKTEKGGVISTGAAELEKLKKEHEIIEYILEHRELRKLKTTYIDVLPTLVDIKTGRLHTTFNQAVTSTGRLSSSDPNLQNIPIQSPDGKEIRKAFVAEKGFVLATFDYSQIELRVAAHLADDTKMIEAFREGVDIHTLTASEIYNVPLAEVTPDLRRAAKTLNFGILYGMGSQALAE